MAANLLNPYFTPEEQQHARRVAVALWVFAATILAALSSWANEPLLA